MFSDYDFDFVDFLRTLGDHWLSEFTDIGDWPWGTLESIAEYIDLFPLVVCSLWSFYGLVCLARSFRRRPTPGALPGYSVLIPFYAEPAGALRSAHSAALAQPPPDEILLVDDGSPVECVGAVLPPRARILRLPRNGGKAAALNAALKETRSEVIVCMDADTVVHTPDWRALLGRFALDARVGAVTGKIWPAHARSLPQLMQALDYLAVIGLVKNAEDCWGGLMTVSGAWVAFRRAALVDAGGWNEATAAEDIDLSWRLQAAGWRVAYEQRWVAHVEMAPSWRGLWRQRRRWSRGLGRAVRDHLGGVLREEATHVPVTLITLLGAGWLWASMLAGALRIGATLAHVLQGRPIEHSAKWTHALVYVALCFCFFLFQLLVATLLDRSRWRLYPKLFLLAPIYPVYFWAISLSTFIVGFPQGLLRRDHGKWRRTVRADEIAAHTEPHELR
jgi:biofilm PGA synthesis N-glycosyltransferase PgaC